jgi:hypothetical protein
MALRKWDPVTTIDFDKTTAIMSMAKQQWGYSGH